MDELIKKRISEAVVDDDRIMFLNAIEVAILALSRNPVATDELLSILCEAYAECEVADRQAEQIKLEDD